MEKKKIILIDSGSAGKIDALLMQSMKEKYGENIVLVTPEQAKEQGLTKNDFENIPTLKFTSPPIHNVTMPVKSGKEKRRERRYKNRKK